MADYSVTAASVVPGSSARIKRYTAGETLTAGQPVYKDSADGKIYKADANVSTKIDVIGITLGGGGAGQPVNVATEDDDFTPGCTLAIGDIPILSTTAGGIAPSADLASGSYGVVLGIAKSTTKMFLGPFLKAGAAKA